MAGFRYSTVPARGPPSVGSCRGYNDTAFGHQHRPIARRLRRSTRSAGELFQAAVELLAREADGRSFRLIGIGAHDLIEAEAHHQWDLCDDAAHGESRIDEVVDAVRNRFGDTAIGLGRGFGVELNR